MPATTANGWPYVQPADHPLDYPATAQQLATMLEARVGIAPAGGVMNVATNVASGAGSSTTLALTGTPTVWGGVTNVGNTLQVPVAGLWAVMINGTWGTNGSGTIRAIWAWMGGGDNPAPGFNQLGQAVGPLANTTGIGGILAAAGAWRLAANDQVRLVGRQDSGVTLTANATLTLRYLHA